MEQPELVMKFLAVLGAPLIMFISGYHPGPNLFIYGSRSRPPPCPSFLGCSVLTKENLRIYSLPNTEKPGKTREKTHFSKEIP